MFKFLLGVTVGAGMGIAVYWVIQHREELKQIWKETSH